MKLRIFCNEPILKIDPVPMLQTIPRETKAHTALDDHGDAIWTMIDRTWNPAEKCVLCPLSQCTRGVDGHCVVMAPGRIAIRDAVLYAQPAIKPFSAYPSERRSCIPRR